MEQRRTYSQEFKQEAINLTRQAGGAIIQVARDLGLNAARLGRWCQDAKQRGSNAFPGTGVPHNQEVARLKRELALVFRSGIFYKKRPRSSPRPPGEECPDSRLSHDVSSASDVSPPAGLTEWL